MAAGAMHRSTVVAEERHAHIQRAGKVLEVGNAMVSAVPGMVVGCSMPAQQAEKKDVW